MQKVYLLRLKVLTNEKRGGLEVILIDRSCCKLFTLIFSYKSYYRNYRIFQHIISYSSQFLFILRLNVNQKILSTQTSECCSLNSLPTVLYGEERNSPANVNPSDYLIPQVVATTSLRGLPLQPATADCHHNPPLWIAVTTRRRGLPSQSATTDYRDKPHSHKMLAFA